MNLLVFFLLGLYHGINPAMGWLLATSVGIEYRSRKALFFALIALTLGHATAIGTVIFGIGWLKLYIPFHFIQTITAITLFALGGYHLYRHWHPKWMTLHVGYSTIFFWSFVVASAHGAGIMLIPFLMDKGGLLLLCIHTLGYFFAALGASFFLFETLKLNLLQKKWMNFELIWSLSLLITAVFIVVTQVNGGSQL